MPIKNSSGNLDLIPGDDLEYSERSQYWQNYRPKAGRGRPKKFNYRHPLILCGHGVRIRIDHNTLLIRDGFTHYPQKSEEIRFFPGDGNLPDRIIILDGSGGISFDALDWMATQKIEFIRLDWRGNIASIGSSTGYSANSQLVQAQRAAQSGSRRFEIARYLIDQKMDRCIETLEGLGLAPEIRLKAISRINIQRAKLRKFKSATSMPSIMGTEGQSAAAYFRAWQGLSVRLRCRPPCGTWVRLTI
jgi:CRISPR-associated protein Cas1